MIDFCIKVWKWLLENEDYVIVVYCKGGKGCMGMMICMWFVDCDMFIEVEVGICCVYYDIMECFEDL